MALAVARRPRCNSLDGGIASDRPFTVDPQDGLQFATVHISWSGNGAGARRMSSRHPEAPLLHPRQQAAAAARRSGTTLLVQPAVGSLAVLQQVCPTNTRLQAAMLSWGGRVYLLRQGAPPGSKTLQNGGCAVALATGTSQHEPDLARAQAHHWNSLSRTTSEE